MDTQVFAAVLAAAVLHAAWNSLIKTGLDRAATVMVLTAMETAIALPLLPFAPSPAPEAWPWIAASAVLHVGYKLFLVQSYARNDLSQSYPLARGAAPLLVAMFTVWIQGAVLRPSETAAILLISGGVLVMALLGTGRGFMGGAALFFALGTAAFTAGYTLVDGTGSRLSGTASGYILWMVFGEGVGLTSYYALRRGRSALPVLASSWKTGLAAGGMSLASYWIVMWAFTRAPVALVAALRESSILFAVAIAAVCMGERVNRWRWAAALAIAGGVVLMKA